MIVGIGVDIIEIKRVSKYMQKERFLKKIFTDVEIELFRDSKFSLSGNFAAKEAVVKAFGLGFSGISPKEVEILRDFGGKPFVNLYGKALHRAGEIGKLKVHISISHSKENAIAYAILELV